MFGHETRVIHFFVPILLILLGGWVAVRDGWSWMWAGVLIWVVAMLMSAWLAISGILDKQRQTVDSDTDFYDTLHAMTDEEREMAGLLHNKDKVRIEHKEERDGGITWKYNFLTISPAKMKTIAYACVNGTPFSLRALAGKEKILSDAEWRTLKDELLEYGYIKPRSEKDDRQGFDWTELGTVMLQDVMGVSKE